MRLRQEQRFQESNRHLLGCDSAMMVRLEGVLLVATAHFLRDPG